MADDDQQYGLQSVDHDPFAVDPMAEPAAISLPPDQPKPEASPQTTPAPAGDGWDRWGAVGGAMKLATAVAHPGSFTNLVADKLSNLSMPTREQWQTGEQALGHTAEHLATLPMRIADKLGLLTTPTEPETPGQVSESDVEKEQARAAAEGTFGASTAMQMVLGGPGAAEEGAAAMGMRGKLTQPDAAAEAARVDQRLPTAKKPIESEGPNRVDTDAMRLTPKSYENNVGLVRNYPGVKIPPRASTDAAADAFVDHVKDNLLWLYDQVPDDIKARSSQWYDGGNKIAKDWAKQYDVPDSTVAGVIAATSPQKDWYNNVSIAKRILDTTKGDRSFYENQKTTPEMEQFFRDTPSLNKPELQPILDEIRGKSLADIDRIMPYPKDERDIYKALWIRLHDQAHVDPSYPLITPEGNFGPIVNAKNTGEPTRVAWGSLPEIAKAVNIVDANGDPVALNQMMGFRHKVRNFYNNLISPMSQAGDVTIDTHAVSAGLLRPVTADSLEVHHNFGNSPGEGRPAAKNSRKTGLFGTYPLYADAYREAAAEAGVLPRQLQSVTWEAVRGLFPEDWKSAKNSAIIDNIWRQYRAGKETLDGARQRILNTTGGIQPPSWYRPARANNAPTQGAGNAPELFEPRIYGPGSQPSFTGTGRGTTGGASAPVVRPSPRDLAYEFDFGAGAPYNEQFPGWASLSGDQKATISKAMLDKIADHAKEVTGANEYARLSGLGGWHEFTNPSYKSRLVATPEVAGDFADTMGYLAQQTKIMGYRPDPAGDRLGLALYGDGLGDEKKLAAFWRDVNDKYPDFSSGFSPSRNQRGQPGIEMLFDKNEPGMADRVKSELIPGLQRLADDHAIGKVDSGIFRATEESREHDWQKDPTGGDYTSRLLARHGPDLLKRLELFKRQELEPALQQHIDAAQGTSPGRGGDRGTGIQETQGAPSLPFRAAASPVKLGSGITDEQSAAARAAAVAAAGRPNLIGLPTENITLAGKPFVPGPVGALHDIAEKYMSDAGLPYDPPKTWVPVDKGRATKIAQAFEDMKHAPDDPQVKASYDAMANETVAQFKALKDSGIKFEFIKPGMDDPYAENPRAAAKDVIENKHLWVFPTEGGFGSGSEAATAAMKNNPLLRPSGEKIEGKEVPVNDLFRIVHDVFGHLKDGNGFRASGEENAWRSHSAMYSDAARPAMTSETRGQNSAVNFSEKPVHLVIGESKARKLYGDEGRQAAAQPGLAQGSGISDGQGLPSVQSLARNNGPMFQPENVRLGALRGTRDYGTSGDANPTRLPGRDGITSDAETSDRQIPGQQRALRAGERPVGDVSAESSQSTSQRATNVGKNSSDVGVGGNSGIFKKSPVEPPEQVRLDRRAGADSTEAQPRWKTITVGEHNRKASAADTIYADQKIGLLPKWAVEEGRGDTHDFQPVNHNPFVLGSGQSSGSNTAKALSAETLYHGTSKDKDFRKFKDARNGTWFTTNPQEASQYAVENDSMNFKYDPSAGKMVRTNTASRVIPVRHSFENTLNIDKWPDSVKHATNYKKAMGDFFDQVRAQGYDSVRQKEPNGHSIVVSLDNSKIRPAYATQRAGGGNVGHIQSTIAPLAQALDQAVPNFDPEALGFRPSTNIEDVRDKPEWQRTIETITRKPMFGGDDDPFGATQRAHGGRVEPKNIDHAPTEAQKAAGNYAKDRIHIHGMVITIENAKGKKRRGVGKDGKPWEVTMPAHYGYLNSTEGADQDQIDAYIGPHQKAPHVYVVDQVEAETKKFDEHKALIGFGSEAQAINTYKRGFSDGKGANRIGTITGMTVAQFRDWLRHGDHGKPFKHVVGRSDRVKEILHRHGLDKSATLQ